MDMGVVLAGITDRFAEVLIDLAEGDVGDPDLMDMFRSAGLVLLESVEFEAVAVNPDGTVTCTMRFASP